MSEEGNYISKRKAAKVARGEKVEGRRLSRSKCTILRAKGYEENRDEETRREDHTALQGEQSRAPRKETVLDLYTCLLGGGESKKSLSS